MPKARSRLATTTRIGSVPAVALLWLLARSIPLSADELERLLKRPLSPGSIALLAKYPAEEGAKARLKLALTGKDAATRGVAARVINVGGITDLLPAVVSALEIENDPDAATEQMRALTSLGGPSLDRVVLASARRLAPKLDRELVRMFARVRGSGAMSLYFESLHKLALSRSDRKAFFRIATRGEPDRLLAASALAFGRRDSASWEAILEVAGKLGHKFDQPLFEEALKSNETAIRGEAGWYLARAYCDNPPQNAGRLLAAMSEGESTRGPGGDPDVRFGTELLKRVWASRRPRTRLGLPAWRRIRLVTSTRTSERALSFVTSRRESVKRYGVETGSVTTPLRPRLRRQRRPSASLPSRSCGWSPAFPKAPPRTSSRSRAADRTGRRGGRAWRV